MYKLSSFIMILIIGCASGLGLKPTPTSEPGTVGGTCRPAGATRTERGKTIPNACDKGLECAYSEEWDLWYCTSSLQPKEEE